MIIVAGTVRIPADRADDAFLAIAAATLAATRREAGCISYSYAFDVEDRGLLRVFEQWASRAALDAHSQQAHMIPWREALAEIGASDRDLMAWEASPGTPV